MEPTTFFSLLKAIGPVRAGLQYRRHRIEQKRIHQWQIELSRLTHEGRGPVLCFDVASKDFDVAERAVSNGALDRAGLAGYYCLPGAIRDPWQ